MALVEMYSNEQDSFPRAAAGTGTVTSYNNRLVGVGTAFLTEAKVGTYIYIKDQYAFRKVKSVQSDTELIIDRAFDTPLSADSFHVTPNTKYTELSVRVIGAGAAKFDGVSFAQGDIQTWKSPEQQKKIHPVDIYAIGTSVRATFDY